MVDSETGIANTKRWEAAEVAVGRPKFRDAVREANGGDAGIDGDHVPRPSSIASRRRCQSPSANSGWKPPPGLPWKS